jgi:CRISPR/Cas system-associated exonuclease Cas4 (RecB family)
MKLRKNKSEATMKNTNHMSKYLRSNHIKIDKSISVLEGLVTKFNQLISMISPNVTQSDPEASLKSANTLTLPQEASDSAKLIKLWVRNNAMLDGEILGLTEKVYLCHI